MSRRIKPLNISTFHLILEYAQKKHSNKSEPIPKLSANTDRLESCLNTPFQKYEGKFLYRGLLTKAAILFYLINKNHPLLNGNKRMACLCLNYFCFINGYIILIPDDQFYEVAKAVVTSDNNRKEEVIKIIEALVKKYWKKRKD